MRRASQDFFEIRLTDTLDRIDPGTQLLVDRFEVKKSVARNLGFRIRQFDANLVHHSCCLVWNSLEVERDVDEQHEEGRKPPLKAASIHKFELFLCDGLVLFHLETLIVETNHLFFDL